MQVFVGAKIRIQNPISKIDEYCRQSLVIDNPDYYKKQSMGKWVGNTPKDIRLYERVGDELRLPFGCLRDIWQICGNDAKWNIEFCPIRAFDYQSHINLYPYQQKAVNEALKTKNGVLVMPCGSGKTQCGLQIISQIGGRALWLTHTQDLLNQSRKRAVDTLANVECGAITEGKVEVSNGITFATVQTMANIDLAQYYNYFDVIVVDECQHCAGSPTRVTQFYKVMSNLSARYKIGLTATPKRADGLEQAMFALLGGVIHEVSREDVAHTTCPVIVTQAYTWWKPSEDEILMYDGTIDYNKVIDCMIHDDDRYKTVCKMILRIQESTIVLGNRVEYLQRLCSDAQANGKRAVCLSGAGQSKKAKEERKEALRKLNDGELDVIFCTYALAAEGLDVPNLRYVIFATPEKNTTTVTQACGRVGRKADGKINGEVIDFVDDFPMYRAWSKLRISLYKKLGYDIIY